MWGIPDTGILSLKIGLGNRTACDTHHRALPQLSTTLVDSFYDATMFDEEDFDSMWVDEITPEAQQALDAAETDALSHGR